MPQVSLNAHNIISFHSTSLHFISYYFVSYHFISLHSISVLAELFFRSAPNYGSANIFRSGLTILNSNLQAELLVKIIEKVKELNTNNITRSDQEILSHRLKLVWANDKVDGKKRSATLWRNTRTRHAYTEIQDANNHLFLAVILIIPPMEYSKTSFDNFLNRLISLDNYEPYHLNLSSAAKNILSQQPQRRALLAVTDISVSNRLYSLQVCETSVRTSSKKINRLPGAGTWFPNIENENQLPLPTRPNASLSPQTILEPSQLHRCTGRSDRKCFATRHHESFRRIHVWCD